MKKYCGSSLSSAHVECFMSLDQFKRASQQIYKLKIKGVVKFGNLRWKWWTLIVFTMSVILPPRKNTQNGFGVSNCYQKN